MRSSTSTARCLSLRSSRSFGSQCAPGLRAPARTPHVGRSCVAHDAQSLRAVYSDCSRPIFEAYHDSGDFEGLVVAE